MIEFQHSRIGIEEKRSREHFYEKLVWVVDGTRLQRDPKQFHLVCTQSKTIGNNPRVRALDATRCTLLREWSKSDVPVFLDFGIPDLLWWLHSKNADGLINVVAFSRVEFINIHLGRSSMARDFDGLLRACESRERESSPETVSPKPEQPRARRLVPRHLSRRF